MSAAKPKPDAIVESQQELVKAFVQALDERDASVSKASDTQWGAIKKLLAFKDIIAAIIFLGSLIGAGYVAFERISQKPDAADVTKAIEVRVKPVEDVAKTNAEAVEKVKDDVGEVKQKVDKMEDVQSYQLEQQAWEGKVLEHLGSKKRGKAPPRPPELEQKERELLQK